MIPDKNSSFKILVVDDDPDLLRITARLLTEKQYIVSTAINGLECNEAIRRDKPELLLLDVMLPGQSGVEICKSIKNDPALSSIFVLLLSGMKTESENISEGLESGADGYIIKPLKNRELLARVEAAIRIIQSEKEISLKNDELRKINIEKDKFFSIIAHDLRNPLSNFLGLTEIMAEQMSVLTLKEMQNISVKMRNSAANLSRLLENLLDWSRMQQGLIPFNPSFIQLLSLVDESISMAMEPARDKGIEITFDIPDDLEVFADTNMLKTVIRNLVSNAVKFTSKGGRIHRTAKSLDNSGVEISIQDSGIGMNREMMDHLFLFDFHTNRKGTEGEPSTGLGLMLCKDFLEKHGGRIWIESEEEIGSTFFITFPSNSEAEKQV
jgi:signal transduction histidine kinase